MSQFGAYGVALRCGRGVVPETWADLPRVPDDWPTWTIERETELPTTGPRYEIADDGCYLSMFHGQAVEIDRASQTVLLRLRAEEPPESVVHPWLASAFAVMLRWAGGLAIHSGVFLVDGQAWGVLGEKGSGKTTTLAGLAESGVTVMSDDMAAFLDGNALIGPRYVDLRHVAATRFPAATDRGRLGLRHRWRLPLGDAPAQAPLAGWIVLGWADQLEHRAVPVPGRVQLLIEAMSLPVEPADPRLLLDLAAVPMIAVNRPRNLDDLSDFCAFVVEAARHHARRP